MHSGRARFRSQLNSWLLRLWYKPAAESPRPLVFPLLFLGSRLYAKGLRLPTTCPFPLPQTPCACHQRRQPGSRRHGKNSFQSMAGPLPSEPQPTAGHSQQRLRRPLSKGISGSFPRANLFPGARFWRRTCFDGSQNSLGAGMGWKGPLVCRNVRHRIQSG